MSITDVYIQPDVRRHRITVTVSGSEGEVRASVTGGAPVTGAPNEPFVVEVPNYEPWQPAAPAFTMLRVELDGDQREIRFAMREATVKDHRFVFNNRPLLLKAARLCDGDVDRNLLERILARGFNALWITESTAAESVLDAADEIGVPLIVELSAQSAESFATHWRNRACIIAWSFSESLAAESVRNVDPSRLIFLANDEGPGYVRPYRSETQRMERVSVAIDYPPSRASENLLRNVGQPGILSLIEPNWIHSDANQTVVESMSARRRRLFELAASTLRANTNVAGYIMPLGIVPDEPDSRFVANTAATMPVIQMHRTNLVPRQDAPVTVTLINEDRLEGRADLSLQVVGPTNQVLWKKKRNVKIPRHGKELWSGTVSASGSTGRHRVVVRMTLGTKIIGEASHPFDVFQPLDKTDQHVDVVGEVPQTIESLEGLGYHLTPSAPVVLVPRLANTVRAYPDNDLAQALGRAYSGAVAIVFAPPGDWNELAELISPALALDIHEIDSSREAVLRTPKLHPVFDSLPARAVMGREYAGVVGPCIGIGESEEEIAAATLLEPDGRTVHASDLIVRRFGSGRVVFAFIDPLDTAGHDPLADRLLDNLVRHFARRSLPSDGTFPTHQKAVEWLRDQRTRRVRRWHVIGPFPNASGTGHTESYPPESGMDATATYPGWFAAVYWKPHFAIAGDAVDLPLDAACREHHRAVSVGDSGTYYAYTEITSDHRGRARIAIDSAHAVTCWLNRAEILRSPGPETLALPVTLEAMAPLRQGRNSILIKCAKTAGTARVRVAVTPEEEPITLRWWN